MKYEWYKEVCILVLIGCIYPKSSLKVKKKGEGNLNVDNR